MEAWWQWWKERSSAFGTLPRWVGALATAVVAGTTVWALISARPIFQNERLKEENAQLLVDRTRLLAESTQLVSDNFRHLRESTELKAALASQREELWDVVCRQLAARVRAVVETATFVWRVYPTVDDLYNKAFPRHLPPEAKSGRELLLREFGNEDYRTMLGEDQTMMQVVISVVIASDQAAMDEPFDVKHKDVPLNSETVARHIELLTRLDKATASMADRCVAANPARLTKNGS